MKLYEILCYSLMSAIIIALNIRAWNTPPSESVLDPLNYIGAVAVLIICGIMMWWEKKNGQQ